MDTQKTIRVLHLEDLPSDAELIARELKKGNLNVQMHVVHNKKMFEQALKEQTFDVILSDHSLSSFNSHEALYLVKEAGITIPFILVTATMSDEFAANVMREGACDYILKDRLHRLPSAIRSAIEKQRLEKEKQATHERLMFHIENSPLGFIEWDYRGVAKSWSKHTESIFGWKEHEFINCGKRIFDLTYGNPRMVYKILGELISGAADRNTIEHRNITKDGRVIWCAWFNSVLRDNKGNVITITSLVQNITEQKEAELERIKITADIIQRNKQLEQFTYIVSHNLRSPVANILGATQAFQDYDLDEEDKQKLSKGIYDAVIRLDEIVKDLGHILQIKDDIKAFAEEVHFSNLVDDIKISIKNLIEDGDVDISYDFSDTDMLMTVKSYLYSIFFNLISNSIKYRRPGIAPRIVIKSYKENEGIRLVFKDNGLGMDLEKTGDQVFGLYRRFHPEIKGKGMGLFMVKTQVESLGGAISVQSAVNKGTSFEIKFKR